MDCATIWNIILSVLSFVLAIVSVCIAISTLKQNNRMIEEATRPIITLLILGDGGLDFVIKNCGYSDAIIKSISHNMVFNSKGGYYPFKDCNGAVIAPGQNIHYTEDYQEFCRLNDENVHVKIEYESCAGKKYCLDQDYSMLALRNQTYSEISPKEKNIAADQVKLLQKIYRTLRMQ